MAFLLAWVSLGACLLLLLVCVALYLDGQSARHDLVALRLATEARLERYAARLAAIEGGPGASPPPGRSPIVSSSDTTHGELVMTRFHSLAVLHRATHCNGSACEPAGGGFCACECPKCASLRALLAQAERETGGE
jgi:hypothetical protein